jgi:hypothetical protein
MRRANGPDFGELGGRRVQYYEGIGQCRRDNGEGKMDCDRRKWPVATNDGRMTEIENLRWQWIRVGYEFDGMINGISRDDVTRPEGNNHGARAREVWKEKLLAWRQELDALLADHPARESHETVSATLANAGKTT